jgi:hypothetical protein
MVSREATETIKSTPVKISALSTSAEAKLKKMDIGIVSVSPGIAPASIIVAPNSPIHLAHTITIEEMSPF